MLHFFFRRFVTLGNPFGFIITQQFFERRGRWRIDPVKIFYAGMYGGTKAEIPFCGRSQAIEVLQLIAKRA
jgi:hypothetical protein